MPRSAPSSLAIERYATIRARSSKHLAPPRRLGEPLDRPHGLVRLGVRGDARPCLDRPHLSLAVESPVARISPQRHSYKEKKEEPGTCLPAEQVLARVAPVDSEDPRAVAHQVRHLLARRHVEQRDHSRVAGCGEEAAGWGEGHGADGLDEAWERLLVEAIPGRGGAVPGSECSSLPVSLLKM